MTMTCNPKRAEEDRTRRAARIERWAKARGFEAMRANRSLDHVAIVGVRAADLPAWAEMIVSVPTGNPRCRADIRATWETLFGHPLTAYVVVVRVRG